MLKGHYCSGVRGEELRLSSYCLRCIVSVRLREIIESNLQEYERTIACCELLRYIAKIVESNPRGLITYIASLAFRRVKELVRDEDPYIDYKILSEQLAIKASKLVRDRLKHTSGYVKFKMLVVASINANSIDPGIASYEFRAEQLEELILNDNLAIDHTQDVYEIVKSADTIVYLLDNCGESILDKLLIEELRRLGAHVYAIVKGGTYQNDVTLRDALRIGLDSVAELISTESDFSSLIPGTYSRYVSEVLKRADLVISKGMAHYETLSELKLERPTLFLLRAKCKPVANSLGIRVGDNVAKLVFPSI